MQMKFMQKTKDKIERQGLDEKHLKPVLDENLNENMLKESNKYVINQSYIYCESLISGRMSFKGMNPEIEKLMQQMSGEKEDNNQKTEESADVSDDEMTNRYSKYINDSNRKRRQFRKDNKSNKRFRHSNH